MKSAARYGLAAAVVLGSWGVVWMTSVGDHDVPSTVLVIGGNILAGAIARSWLILPAAVGVAVFGAIAPCDSSQLECDDGWAIATFVFMPMAFVLLIVGVALGKLVGWLISRRRAA